jgi:hypothetical protein
MKWEYFNPFKNKASIKNWFQFPYSEKTKWEKLARHALVLITEELKSNTV